MPDWRKIERELIKFFETEGFFARNGGDWFMVPEDFDTESDEINVTELARRIARALEARAAA